MPVEGRQEDAINLLATTPGNAPNREGNTLWKRPLYKVLTDPPT